ncbi:methylenetetrahydrofolate reductase [Nocardioides sp. NPDC127503]|uniref:methylenetetrahydrofolate reductase n=1 Tax=Nocardioides sp. NPDC127503 TaxID=3154516 RepID=UPI003318BED3
MPTSSNTTLLLGDPSLEMTAKDVDHIAELDGHLPRGTRVNITFLGNESSAMRVQAADAVGRVGFVPVPHLSARRLESHEVLQQFLAELQSHGASDDVFVVAGDPPSPQGPYEDALDLIESGLLERYGVKSVGIAGYPDGHPHISEEILWSSLHAKVASLQHRGLSGAITTQFGFDLDLTLDWVQQTRNRGIDLPIRIGVPGPAGIRRLLSYAKRFGVGSSASIAKKYGFSITNILGTAGPDLFIDDLRDRYDPIKHGEVGLHFYTFGGLGATSEWLVQYSRSQRAV